MSYRWELTDDCKDSGWKVWCLPIEILEIGCRGFSGQSTWKCLKLLGIIGKVRKDLIKCAENHAQEASRWIFNKRNDEWQSRPKQIHTEKAVKVTPSKNLKVPREKRKRIHFVKQPGKVNPDVHFFFGYKMSFSNFHRCLYQVELPDPYGKKEMHSVEQLYMFRKAYFFADHSTCKKILEAPDALATKRLGSSIDGFISAIWTIPKVDVMKECLVRKFTDSEQKERLMQCLMESPTILVEASPSDLVWGIGFSKEDGPYISRDDWGEGENMLGRLLMGLKQYIQTRESLDPNVTDPYGFQDIYRKVHRNQKFKYDREVYMQREPREQEPFRDYLKYHNSTTT